MFPFLILFRLSPPRLSLPRVAFSSISLIFCSYTALSPLLITARAICLPLLLATVRVICRIILKVRVITILVGTFHALYCFRREIRYPQRFDLPLFCLSHLLSQIVKYFLHSTCGWYSGLADVPDVLPRILAFMLDHSISLAPQ